MGGETPRNWMWGHAAQNVVIVIIGTKGQLISEWLFDLLIFPKYQCKNLMNFCPRIPRIGKINALFYTNYVKYPLISNKELFIIIKCLYFFDWTTFYILGQKFIKFLHWVFGNSKHQKRKSEVNWPLSYVKD